MSAFFIRRPIVAMVIAIITVIIGIVSLLGLPIAQFPQILPPQVNLTTTYTGADALTIEQSVATPIEQQMNGVDRMLYIQSTNANDGSMNQVVTFDVGTDPDIDNVLVNNRFSQAQPFLPQDVKNFGVTIKKSLAFPLMVISLYSPDGRYDASFLTNYANINVNDALLRVKGVGDIRNLGSSDYAMRVWLKPELPGEQGADGHRRPERRPRAERREPGRPDRRGAGAARAAAHVHGARSGAPRRGRGVRRTSSFARTPTARPCGSSDVARIELGSLNYQQDGTFNGKPGAVIAAFQTPGSNALDVAERHQQDDDGPGEAVPAGHRLQALARHDARP